MWIWRSLRSRSAARPEACCRPENTLPPSAITAMAWCSPPDHKTMAHYFNEAGYFTGYIGKWHLANGRHAAKRRERRVPVVAGSQLIGTHSQAYNTLVYDNDDNPVHLPGYRGGCADRCGQLIDENKDDEKPFFYSCPSWSLISRTALTISRLRMYTKNMVSGYAAGSGCA